MAYTLTQLGDDPDLTPGRCLTPNQVRTLANRVATHLDPDAAITRRVKAEKEREITVHPAIATASDDDDLDSGDDTDRGRRGQAGSDSVAGPP
ncbi:MAG: hypothetical protein ABI181_05395 [Mycobacteriaceae bacterium]